MHGGDVSAAHVSCAAAAELARSPRQRWSRAVTEDRGVRRAGAVAGRVPLSLPSARRGSCVGAGHRWPVSRPRATPLVDAPSIASTPTLLPMPRARASRTCPRTFTTHATAFLAAGLFEQHDRARLRSSRLDNPDDRSAMRARLVKAFDRFVDVKGATRADRGDDRADGVDILLVDLRVTRRTRPPSCSREGPPIRSATWAIGDARRRARGLPRRRRDRDDPRGARRRLRWRRWSLPALLPGERSRARPISPRRPRAVRSASRTAHCWSSASTTLPRSIRTCSCVCDPAQRARQRAVAPRPQRARSGHGEPAPGGSFARLDGRVVFATHRPNAEYLALQARRISSRHVAVQRARRATRCRRAVPCWSLGTTFAGHRGKPPCAVEPAELVMPAIDGAHVALMTNSQAIPGNAPRTGRDAALVNTAHRPRLKATSYDDRASAERARVLLGRHDLMLA